MFDPVPDSIVSLLSRRAVRTSSEQLKLTIDSYHDRKTAFELLRRDYGSAFHDDPRITFLVKLSYWLNP
ncbi:MAG: hypothetical protein ABI601_01190 [bacterium]